MSQLGFSKKDNYTRCKNSAIYSLAMREHSRKELYNKLQKKDYVEGVDLEKLLDELEDSNYLNEQRFTESFIRYRASRGQGPVKISSELYNRGIIHSMINESIDNSEIDWFDLALKLAEKKYGLSESKDYKEKSKRMRFLVSRGFTSEIIQTVIK